MLFRITLLLFTSLSLLNASEWLYYKHYPWVYDNVSKDWLYLRGSNDGKIYAYRASSKGWEEFDANQTAVTFDSSNPPDNLTLDINSTVNLEMIWVNPGTFNMGSPEDENQRQTDETQKQVTITNGFYLGKFEITGAQYEAVMDGNSFDIPTKPSTSHFDYLDRSAYPVETVPRIYVEKFITTLNDLLSSDIPLGWTFKLPTEAEWEYSCRAGSTTAFSWGNTISLEDANWYDPNNVVNRTKEPGQYSPNLWGFYDMHGNVMELCEDMYSPEYNNDQSDPVNLTGSLGVVRGGGFWTYSAFGGYPGTLVRSAARWSQDPASGASHIGFRIALKKTN